MAASLPPVHKPIADAVTLSAATITLTTTDSDVTFGGTIDSDAGQTNHLTIDTNGTTGTIQFGGLVGNTVHSVPSVSPVTSI